MAPVDEHSWIRARLASWRSGLLTDPAEEKRLDSHLARCPSCSEAAMLFAPDPADNPTDGHIPAGLIARWDRLRDSISGLERAMILEHLEECASCRGDLERLGFEPALAPEPAAYLTETSPAPHPHSGFDSEQASSDFGRPSIRNGPGRASIRDYSRRSSILQWVLGSWAVAMTAAALIFAVTRPGPHRDGEAARMVGIIAPLRAEASPTLVLSSLRGDARQIIEMTDKTRSIILGLPDIRRFPTDQEIEIEVTSEGASLLRQNIRAGEMTSRDALVLTRGDSWAPGTYHLLVRQAGALRIEYVFDMRRTADK